MDDNKKTKRQLIEELNEQRQRVAQLEGLEEEIVQMRGDYEKFTRAFLQSSVPVGITTFKEGRFVEVSDAFLRLMGRKRDEVIGHTATGIRFITEEQRRAFFYELNKKGRIENLEMKVRAKDGALIEGLFNAVMMNLKNEKYLLTVMTDITDRKRAEESLQLSRERLEEAQRIANIGNWEANLVTGELYWSQVIFDIFGFDSESFKPSVEEFYKAVHPSDRDLVLESEKRSEHTGLHDVVHRIVRPNGEVRFIHELAKRYTDNNGNLIMLRGTVQDITDRKHIEHERLEAEEKYRTIFENAVEGIFQTSMDGRFMSANPALADIFGYDSCLNLMDSVTDIGRQLYVNHENRKEHLRLLDEKGQVKGFETQMYRKDGSICLVSINTRCVRNGIGEPMHYEGFITDITERKRMEEAQRESEERYRSLFEASQDGIFIVDKETGNFVSVNSAACRLYGYTKDELLQMKHYDISAELEKTKTAVQNSVTKVPLRLHRKKDGTIFPVEIAGGYFMQGGRAFHTAFIRDISERKHNEEVLRENEEKYRVIFNNEIYAICIFDTETLLFLDVNKAYCDLYGWRREELISGMTINDITAEHELSAAATKQAIHEGTMFIPLRYHRKRDGTVFPVEIVGGPYTWKGCKVMFALAHDITERKLMEEALLKVNQQYDKLVHNIPVGVYIMRTTASQSFVFEYVSPKVAEIFGTNTESFLAYPQVGFKPIHPDDLDGLVKLNQDRFQQQQPFHWEGRAIIDGEVKWLRIESSPEPVGNGDILWHGLVTDITERRRAEDALRNSEKRLDLALKATQDAIWDWDLLANTIYYSPHWWSMVGYEENELESDSNLWRRLMHPEDLERANLIVTEAVNSKTSFEVETRLLHKDGYYVPVLTKGFVLRDDSNKSIRVSGANTDLTGQKKIEEERVKWERQQHQLQKSESLSRMAGAIAHHFNNQLGAVIGNLEMALGDLPQGTEPVKVLNEAMQAAEKAAKMSGLMLTYLGQTSGKRESLDISEVCFRSLPIFRAIMPGKRALEADLPLPGPVISANANQIQQVLSNLITNAWEAVGEDGGSIHLGVKTVSHKDIKTSNLFPSGWIPQDNNYACLEVMDTGCGIKNEDFEKLFDPFYSTKYTGRGLGLAVVIGILKSHNGAITVESESGRGSIFRVFLPTDAETMLRQPDLAIRPQTIKGGGTVLLVEDEEMVRNMAAGMLKHLGFTVLKAKDGVEAVDVFRKHQDKIICVLSDLTMPHMNGWETLTSLRKLVPDIPVILASGYDEAHVMAGDHPELPQVFLGKPYKLKGLSDAICQALAGGGRR